MEKSVSRLERAFYWALRIGAACCFIGHGAFGLITKEAWLPFFAVAAIPPEIAYVLMPAIGCLDIFLGTATLLIRPRKAFLAYMAVWAVWTALLRPLAGQGWWEFFERAGNYGIPYVLFLLGIGSRSLRGWFAPITPRSISAAERKKFVLLLKIFTAALLFGHGGYCLVVQKKMLLGHLAAVGAGSAGLDLLSLLKFQGVIEFTLGAAVLLFSSQKLYLIIFGWKLFTELFYPLSGDYIWEFIERAGSYAAPIALYYLSKMNERNAHTGVVAPSH